MTARDSATSGSDASVRPPYDHRNCQSLFGYAAAVHARSGGVCALCGYGGRGLDFDAWRQLTIEHLIGNSQGGYPPKIRAAVTERFPGLSNEEIEDVVARIDVANTVTACSFCNSTTSRARSSRSMPGLIADSPSDPREAVRAIEVALGEVLAAKRAEVEWKLESVRLAYERNVETGLARARGSST